MFKDFVTINTIKMRKKQSKKVSFDLQKVKISRLHQESIFGGIVAGPTHPQKEYSCSCTCYILGDML